ncbi:MAG TPA: family 20 glycosylhydrolase [Chitinophagaceae bacterium]|nr:family 20 glycosylhydrolase [Chitinophagaceae bacterium]HNF45371.1 family 20 glycosylhydrolase [Chitinophagaceae bacterium]HNJ54864.1 family 20 glycosylhydrolase [Chitinophagaceae bacterium]HNL58609.1 family 20 glycosylhydrolase [Chitinophagaceae bacterium]
MKKPLFIFCFICSSLFLFAQSSGDAALSLIPQPVSIVQTKGSLVLPHQLSIYTDNNAEVNRIANSLSLQLASNFYKVKVVPGKKPLAKAIHLYLVSDKSIPADGYRLKITATGVSLSANSPSGIFFGVQTLLQLFPKEIVNKDGHTSVKQWSLPLVSIEDHPRFGWRGLMLDVTRHFFTVAQVKDYIDQMVKYKFNMLHLHLTDDQGWRIEIKSLPKLTEVGAWRVERTGTFGTFPKPQPGEKPTYGGFYTHEDIKELVKYAADRFVNILPEIDVPGHSLAALASYPDLSCTPGEYYVSPGDRFMVWPGGGQHFYGLIDNTLCPANEKVYEFLDKVFTEVAQLFPFQYIHMGGDETARNFWEKDEQIKALMKKENLKNLDEVQSYFVKRVEKIINSKGKKMIGWDEILQGGLAPNAAVMSWRGMSGGIEAAKSGHEVVMSPTDFVYIDYMQGDASIEPPVYSTLRLKKTYSFEPLPEGVNEKLIRGGQANLWTEQVYNMRHAQYMTWPRALAVAEVLWSPKEKRNWNGFVPRVEKQFERMDAAQVKYAPSLYDPIITVSKKDSATIIVTMDTEVEGLTIHYSFDNSFPDNFYQAYKAPLTVPNESAALKLVTYKGNKLTGRQMVITMAELKKRAGIK